MDTMSGFGAALPFLSAAGATAAGWKGQHGPTAVKHFSSVVAAYSTKHQEALSKNKDLPCTTGLELLKAGLPSPHHQAYLLLEEVAQLHRDYMLLADVGLMGPKDLSPEIVGIIRKQHSASIDTDKAIKTFMAEHDEVYNLLIKNHLALETHKEMEQALEAGITARDWVASKTHKQPQGEAVAGLALRLAVEEPVPPADLSESAAACWLARTKAQQKVTMLMIEEGRPMPMLAGSRRHTAHSALLLRIVGIMLAIYGPGDETQYQELLALRRPGAQGTDSLPEFAARVEQLYTSVKLLSTGVEKLLHISVFLEGLNNHETRSYLKTFVTSKHWTLSLREVMEEASKYEASSRELQMLDVRQAAVQQSVLGRKGAAGSSSNSSAAGTDVSSRLASQQQHIDKMLPEEQKLIYAAYELAKTAPNNPNAICLRCRSSAKPHVNAACKNRDKGEPSGGKAHGNLAASNDEQLQALLGRVSALEAYNHGSSSCGAHPLLSQGLQACPRPTTSLKAAAATRVAGDTAGAPAGSLALAAQPVATQEGTPTAPAIRSSRQQHRPTGLDPLAGATSTASSPTSSAVCRATCRSSSTAARSWRLRCCRS
jgi:hypothetical protein